MVTNCNQLRLRSPKDGKNYKTDAVNTRDLLRIIQSIPSPKAEPFKMWLAHVGNDRLDEIADPKKLYYAVLIFTEQKDTQMVGLIKDCKL